MSRIPHGLALAAALLIAFPSPARSDRALEMIRMVALRGIGVVAGLGIHEGCHLATGKAMGARFSTRPNPNGPLPVLIFSGLEDRQDRVVAVAGNGCTAIAAELIVATGLHRKSDLLWGIALFHAWNAHAYAFVEGGDATYWSSNGGNVRTWQTLHTLHAARIGNALARDAGLQYLSLGPPPGDPWEKPHRWEIERGAIQLPIWTERNCSQSFSRSARSSDGCYGSSEAFTNPSVGSIKRFTLSNCGSPTSKASSTSITVGCAPSGSR